MTRLETDYLVVGAGAAGMAFADSLVAHSDADVVLVDRRHRPGGHWHDAYSFVRLHLPSAYYGVTSTALGGDTVDRHGPNAGMYEQASAAEICAYYDRVLDNVLLPTGRVRFLGMHDAAADASSTYRLVSRLTGASVEVAVRRKVVDATYLESAVPATHTPSFAVHPDARLLPVGELVRLEEPAAQYVIIGAGKTAIDACLWLLDHDVEPSRIRWIRPRDAWLLDRERYQPLDQVASTMEGLSLDLEALAGATSRDDLFQRLERSGRFRRIDPQVVPTMFHGATMSLTEIELLRRVTDVVRLGHVLRVGRDEIVLQDGAIPTGADCVHVDCTAAGLKMSPARPVFEEHRITLQQVRCCQPTFNAALIGYIEATRHHDEDKNRLCPPNPYPDVPDDWLRGQAVTLASARAWSAEPDVADWVERCRLNLMRGMGDHMSEPRMAEALERFGRNVRPGVARLRELLGQPESLPGQRQPDRWSQLSPA